MAKAAWSSRERLVPPDSTPGDEQAQQQKNGMDAAKLEGHVMWAGGERVVGWGEVSQP